MFFPQFFQHSSNSISGRVYFPSTVTSDNAIACGLSRATVTAYEVDGSGVVSSEPLGTPVLTGHVGDSIGKYSMTIPRNTKFTLKVKYWNDNAVSTCGNSTWLLTCNTANTAHTTSANHCGCSHQINLKSGKDAVQTMLNADVDDYDFEDVTTQTVTVQAFGGACQHRLGAMTVKIAGQQCTLYADTLDIPDGSIQATKVLPALPYIVKFDATTITAARTGISKGKLKILIFICIKLLAKNCDSKLLSINYCPD